MQHDKEKAYRRMIEKKRINVLQRPRYLCKVKEKCVLTHVHLQTTEVLWCKFDHRR